VPDPSLVPWVDERTPALAIVARGDQIRSVTPTRFVVRSQSRPNRQYAISIRRDRWSCTCAYHRLTRRVCIHILAVRIRDRFEDTRGEEPGPRECPRCGASRTIQNGKRHNRTGVAHRYLCKQCGVRFTVREGGLHHRRSLRTIAFALDLYFRGLSLRKVADHLRQAHGESVSPATIHGWLGRFGPAAARWMDSLEPRTGEQWNADETVVKVNGSPRWIWNVMDASTRYLLATHVTRVRRSRDARVLLRRAKGATPDRPLAVLTDGLSSYRTAVGRELAFRSGGEVVNPHVRVPSIRAKRSNNLVERLHGTEKDRIKVLRGFHSTTGPKQFIEGFRAHYNMVRPHGAVGTTPAVAAGLPDLGGFRWEGILRESRRRPPRPRGEAEIVFLVRRSPRPEPEDSESPARP
jgi:putative transposase